VGETDVADSWWVSTEDVTTTTPSSSPAALPHR